MHPQVCSQCNRFGVFHIVCSNCGRYAEGMFRPR
ncbi:MAG: 50S ribosomal protein L32 [Limnohabitans sp.]